MNIGHAIKLCRQQRGCTQSELAKLAGISISYLSLLERGERSDPGLSTIEKVAAALDIPLSLLFFVAADPSELKGLSHEIVEKLSTAAFDLMKRSE